MPKIVEVQGLGNVEFPDSMSDAQITSAIQSDILPKVGAANAPVGRGGVLASGAEALLTGLTDVPEGIAGLFNPRPEETRAGKFSQAARSGIQSILGINPEAQPTTAETAASALGSVGSFLLPFVGQEMAATRLLGGAGEAAAAARSIGKAATATQAAGLGVEQQIQSIKDKEATGELLTDEQRLKAQRLGGAIGLTDLIPLSNYMGPLEAILAKVPLSKVGPAKRVVGEAVQKALLSATEEGAQEAFSQAAQNLVAQGIYDPSVNITDGLLANAGAGGFAGGTLDVILQLVAGHKAGRGVKAQEQYLKKRAEEAKAGGDEAIRADAQNGLESIRQISPLGNISVQREAVLDKETGKTSDAYHLVGEDGTKLASFLSPDAAVLAGQQYEKDARGLAKFNAPTVGEMASKSILEDTAPEEKAAGKVKAQALKQEDAFKPSPTTTTTTPEGQAATGATIEGLSTETGVPPAELTPSAKPQKGRIRRLQAKAEEVVPQPETPPPAPFEGLKSPEQPFPRPPERMTPERELEMRAAGLSDADLLAAGLGQPNQFSIPPEKQTPQAPQAETTGVPPPPAPPAPPTTPPRLTLDAVRNALPKDRFGNPDMGVLVDAITKIRKGKPVPWDLLTDAQKTTIAKKVAPSLFPKPGVKAVAAPATGTAAPFTPRTSVNFRPSEATAEGRAAAKVFDEKMDTVVKEVNKALAPLGLKNVRVQFSNFLKAKTGSGEQVFPQGYVNSAGDVIFLATNIYDPNLSAEQNAQKVVEIMNHEVIHSLVNLGLFNPGEIKTLFDAVQNINYPGSKFTYFDRAVGTYGTVYKNADGSPNMEMIVEEGVAEMFRDWNAGRLKLSGTPQGLFQRMLEFIKRLFRGMKNAKVENVFRSIKAGELGAREARPAAASATKFATAQNLVAYDNPAISYGDKDWLARKQKHAEEKMAEPSPGNASGKGLFGPSTAYTRRPIDMNVNFVSQLPGANDEKRIPGNYKFDALLQKVKKEGWDPTPIMILVNHKGDAYISEGNTRAAVAKSLGIETIPAEIQWKNGAELSGRNTPKEMLANSSGPTAGATKFSVPAQLTGESEQEFARWWGDATHTLEDANGIPIPVYTGTSKDKIFESFQEKDRGIWVTTNPEDASSYAIENDSMGYRYDGWNSIRTNTASRVIPLFTRIKNPLDLSTREKESAFFKANNIRYQEGANGYQKAQAQAGRIAKGLGHDSINWGPGVYAIFNAKDLKSTFNPFEKGAAESKKFSTPAQLTGESEQEFRDWFKQSKATDRKGNPQVFYNGRTRPLREGQVGRGASGAIEGESGPFFFSPDPAFANDYAMANLSKLGDRKNAETGLVLPAYLSVQNPWDYKKSFQVDDVVEHIANRLDSGEISPDSLSLDSGFGLKPVSLRKLGALIESGDWDAIELPAVQRAIRDLGHDGFYLVESGVRNIAVYNPEQIKSVFNTFEAGTAESKKFSISPSGETKPELIAREDERQIILAKDTADDIAEKVTKPGANIDDLASAGNIAVKNAVSKLSITPQSAPMPPALSAANDTLFAKDTSPRTIGEKLMGMFGGLGTADGRTRIMDTIRVNFVHKEGQFNKIEQQAYVGGVLPEFEQRFKEYSAVAAMDMRNRASHYTVETMQNGAPVIKMIDPRTGQTFRAGQGGDANSMYMEVEPDPENTPAKIFEILLTSGPGGASLVDHFRSYAISQVAKKRIAEGKEVPAEITPQYMAEADQLGVTYPQIFDAFTRYQNFNAKLMKAALDAGVIDRAGYDRFLDGMNYYSMYRQFEEEPIVPGTSPSLGSQIKVREYAGGEAGNLMANPITAMMYNVAFWNNAILQNIASQKALRVGKLTGLMKELKVSVNANGTKTIEQPDVNAGFFDKVFYTNINGVATPFATKDPLLAVGLMSSPQANLEGIFKLFGMPTSFLREMVTRDPGFMIANLLRDSVSTWVLAGSGAKPHETFIGLKNALLKTGSYQNLRNFGVIGSFDEAQKSPEKFVSGLSKKIIKKQGGAEIMDSLTWAWDNLEKVSEASDAATRIAVYDAAKRAGESDFTAAYRSLSIMNFSRSGASAGLRIYTKLVPFLNARIQGFDVLYTGLKAGVNVLAGKEQTEFDRQRGTAVLYRGMGLMAAAMALALINQDDEDYKQLPQYIKDSNLLIPVGGGKFLSVPKPFEAGLLFMTVPTTLYDMAAGNRSMRSGLSLFYNQFSSTFGFNPTPQFALPIYENITNRDFYTGLPLVSPGQEKLDASLQYNASTSYVARGIGKALKYSPMGYNIETGRFEGVSPILIDNLISGYGGPIASYIGMGIGGITSAFGTDNQGLPVAASNLPVIRRFFIDAQDKQPQAAADAYDLYQQVDRVNRTVSRLKKMGDIEALKEYRAENIDVLRVGKQVRKMADNLNSLRAQLRKLEANKVMSGQEKLAKMRELRSREITLTNRINEINQKLGR
jgi:hypothetical protein